MCRVRTPVTTYYLIILLSMNLTTFSVPLFTGVNNISLDLISIETSIDHQLFECIWVTVLGCVVTNQVAPVAFMGIVMFGK